MNEKDEMSRRSFIRNAAVTGAAVTIVPRHVLGRGFTPPSDLLNIACVGVGGMGRSNLINLASQNLVALCDVDWGYTDKNLSRLDTDIANLQQHIDHPDATAPNGKPAPKVDPEKAKARMAEILHLKNDLIPKAKRYSDYRKMLDEQKDIDAVVVATPDHMHAPIALASMDLKKHVYVQKPLCWSVDEARKLAKKAQETKVATQMGNQGRSLDDTRTAVEYIWSGAIGEVREIHVWTDRPVGFWPQGVPRPKAAVEPLDTLKWDQAGVDARLAAAMAGNYPIPETLSWNLFLGVGPEVPYHPIYHPFNWRGWTDWGCGAIGDMGAHLLDVSMWALNLGLPTSIETVSTPFNGASFPSGSLIFYEFPARGSMPPVKLTWYDGGLMPPKPVELGNEELIKEGGAILVGSKGKLMHNTYGAHPRLLPQSLQDSVGKPPEKLARIPGESHELNWVDAAKGKTQTDSPFEYAAKLTEVMLLGVVALKAGQKIAYDGANMQVTNVPAANQYLSRQYRTGW
ncbi:MAG TPA: Gfo/Idh/MocA family oxidoreductase [Candidatus Sulfotelmatobacter sp.]|nr:Gfo/Idh/MocA family oxidoreductase [Candidatus Sulfotelmatobacter sp.]